MSPKKLNHDVAFRVVIDTNLWISFLIGKRLDSLLEILLEEWMKEAMVMVELGDIPRRCRDPKDDYLLELAVQANAIYLVSGDDDLLSLGHIEGCRIMTVDQFETEWNLLKDKES